MTQIKSRMMSFVVAMFAFLVVFVMGPKLTAQASVTPNISTQLFYSQSGWADWKKAKELAYQQGQGTPSAVRVAIEGQPSYMTGTVRYSINSSGQGWLDWVENGAEIGAADQNGAPMEAIKMEVNGQLAFHYDVYYKVYQNKEWSDWKKNGEVAGTEGKGLQIEGLAVAMTRKGAPAPADNVFGSKNLGSFDPSRPMVALTFDDGPKRANTERILTVLEKYNARATFFMVGKSVDDHSKDLLERMVRDGDELGNHTYDHKQLTKLTPEQVEKEITTTSENIYKAVGQYPTVMRPPYGDLNKNIQGQINGLGYPVIIWSLDTLDWKTRNTQSTINAILNNIKDGDVVLMHDLQDSTPGAVEVVVPELVRRGYQLVTVSELASTRGGLKAGHNYGSFRPK